MRIITEASTAWEVLVLMRSMSRLLTSPMSCAAKALPSKNTPMPIIRFMLWFFRILPVTRLYTLGSIMPTSVAASVARAINITSPWEMLFFIYMSRSGMPSFFMGRG